MKKWHGALAAVVALIALGCGSGVANDPDAKSVSAGATKAAAAEGAATTEPTDPPTQEAAEPTPASFGVTVKVTKKTCFGSAGCNIVYHIDVITKTDLDPDQEYLVTYEVSGVEDGPQVNSFTIQGDKYSRDDEEIASTKSKSAKLAAKVTAVEKN